LRRQAQVKRIRPDLEVVGFRGNVQTRLKKLTDGVADATLLACAGLNRLGMADRITSPIETSEILPAVAQGAIAIEIRSDDTKTAEAIAPLNHPDTAICVTAERAFLTRLEGSCRTPIAGLATLDGGTLKFHGMVFSVDGERAFDIERDGPAENAVTLGIGAADALLELGAEALLARAT
jgi:hydroxymethylbilane synthase